MTKLTLYVLLLSSTYYSCLSNATENSPMFSQKYPSNSAETDQYGILDIGEPNWNYFQRNYPVKLVNFFIPWCKHCKTFGPDFDRLAPIIYSLVPGIGVAKIDISHWSTLKTSEDVKTVPCLRLYYGDDKMDTYDGMREPEDVLRWIVETLEKDPRIVVNRDAVKELNNEGSYVIAGIAMVLIMMVIGLGRRCTRTSYKQIKHE